MYVDCTVGARNDRGESPLDQALECYSDGCVEVSLFLLSPGYGGDQEKIKLLNGACYLGELDVVKDLVEQQKVDPSECSLQYCITKLLFCSLLPGNQVLIRKYLARRGVVVSGGWSNGSVWQQTTK